MFSGPSSRKDRRSYPDRLKSAGHPIIIKLPRSESEIGLTQLPRRLTKTERRVDYRQARLDDAGDILALLLKLAPEIPLVVEPLEREEALYALIRNCARSGESWVAVDPGGHIVGFVLVMPNQAARHYAENEALDLRYAGVMPECRRQGVFGALIGKVLARMMPVTTTVAPQNRSGVAAHLARLGFRPLGGGDERHLRWAAGKP